RLLVLCRDGKTPSVVAHMLARKGFADSVMTVFEHLGGVRETRREAIIYEWTNEPCADLCLIALDCVLDAGLSVPGALPGLEDDLFDHDGMMTKREVRTVTLSSLAPTPGALLWDVGAGCGSVAIEWMRVQSRTKAVAFESDRARIAKLARNAVLLGVPELDVVFGRAPAILAERPDDEIPDAVFIGGGLGEDGVLEACWERLRVGGTLVANAVTIEAELRLMAWHQDHGGDLSRISVSRLEPISDRFNAWKAAAPVTHYRVIKQ
ncbi:MAG: precorrin-6Y C5,15-methyltransferase (decarboxylating) subunit CbiT, partial [Rhodospirillaceae bacterium]